MRSSRFIRTLAAAALVTSLLAPSALMSQAEPLVLDALEAQEAAADILDTYERLFKLFPAEVVSRDLIDKIEQARGAVFAAPPDQLQVMGEMIGEDLVTLRRLSREQARQLLAPPAEGPFADLDELRRVQLASGNFPTLLPGLPDYPFGSINVGASEAEIEAVEGETEERESENEAGGGSGSGFQSFTCQKIIAANGRVNRSTSTAQFIELGVMKIAQLADGIAHDFCSWNILGFDCAPCCVVTTVIRVLAEALHEAIQLCEGLTDGAEIEATFHNVLSTFDGVSHVHDDLDAHAMAIATQLTTHDTTIRSELATHHTNISNQLATHDTDIKGLLGTVQDTLDNEVELRRVHIDVIEIQERKKYMVVTTEAGLPVDVVFTNVSVSKSNNVNFVDVTAGTTVSPVAVGVYELELSSSPSITDLISISVRHDDVVDHFGQVVFHRVNENTNVSQ